MLSYLNLCTSRIGDKCSAVETISQVLGDDPRSCVYIHVSFHALSPILIETRHLRPEPQPTEFSAKTSIAFYAVLIRPLVGEVQASESLIPLVT